MIKADRLKGRPFVVERERVSRAQNSLSKHAIAERDRPNRPIDCCAKLLDRNAKVFHCVEDTEKIDVDFAPAFHRGADLTI